jgi:flagellar L-ring protein precursor FlgH
MMKLVWIGILAFVVQGCATVAEEKQLEKELTPVPVAEVKPAEPVKDLTEIEEDEEPVTKYSQINNMAPPSDRQYKRMTRKKMEEESELNSSAGSLWKMEGQTSYLFAQNKHRRPGDPTTIKMEGPALKIVESKAQVIQELLAQLAEQKLHADDENKKAEEQKLRLAQIQEEKKLRAERIARGELVVDPMDEQMQEMEAKAAEEAARAPASTAAAKAVPEEKIDLKDVESIPSKIVEKMDDDTYRIRGQQFLTIKKKPYKVIATALVRAEDFNDAAVSSTKLIDAQYDVIHVKRAAQ